MKGNVVDLAIGIIIGGAFGTIVTSLVGAILMPVIGVVTGGIDFSGLAFELADAKIAYGKFIQATFSFLIIAFALFMLVRGMNRLKAKEVVVHAGPSEDVKLLTEIRDLLKK